MASKESAKESSFLETLLAENDDPRPYSASEEAVPFPTLLRRQLSETEYSSSPSLIRRTERVSSKNSDQFSWLHGAVEHHDRDFSLSPPSRSPPNRSRGNSSEHSSAFDAFPSALLGHYTPQQQSSLKRCNTADTSDSQEGVGLSTLNSEAGVFMPFSASMPVSPRERGGSKTSPMIRTAANLSARSRASSSQLPELPPLLPTTPEETSKEVSPSNATSSVVVTEFSSSTPPETYDREVDSISSVEKALEVCNDFKGCRFVQSRLDLELLSGCRVLVDELSEDLSKVSDNAYGNYVYQKLLEHADDDLRLKMLKLVSKFIAKSAFHLHGTRCAQKHVELCSTESEAQIILDALCLNQNDVFNLAKDLHGNHACERLLTNEILSERVSGMLLPLALELSKTKHGCVVVQHLFDAYASKRDFAGVDSLIASLEPHVVELSKHPFGNYVVQHLVKKTPLKRKTSSLSGIFNNVGLNLLQLVGDKHASCVVETVLMSAPHSVCAEWTTKTVLPRLSAFLKAEFSVFVIKRLYLGLKGKQHESTLLELVEAVAEEIEEGSKRLNKERLAYDALLALSAVPEGRKGDLKVRLEKFAGPVKARGRGRGRGGRSRGRGRGSRGRGRGRS